MKALLIAVILLLEGEPSDDLKNWILKQAYFLNDNSMVRWGCIDMTKQIPEPCPIPESMRNVGPDKKDPPKKD